MSVTTLPTPATMARPPRVAAGFRIEAERLTVIRRRARLLTDVSLTIEPGQLVAIIGGSGAGKTTLLDALAGVRVPAEGTVRFDGLDLGQHRDRLRSLIGYVPQDDIIHRDLPTISTVRYAARLRLPGATRTEVDTAVERVLTTLALGDQAAVRVGDLSGGQRKRVSLSVELLTRPRALFLDEPTSGLDPATARALLVFLRELADGGTTVVLTTHNLDDVRDCDGIVALGRGGRLAFHGRPQDAPAFFGVGELCAVYDLLSDPASVESLAARFTRQQADRPPTPPATDTDADGPAGVPSGRQWTVLVSRNVDVLLRNRLTLAIMVGSPVLVIAMFTVLFRSGAFDPAHPSPVAAVSITYWLAFAAFFFGLTYGLLQIVTEAPILRRERLVGLRVGPYLLGKAAVLVPVLLVVNLAMLAVLRATDRLPVAGLGTYAVLTAILLLDAVVALVLGLLASAAATDPSQATLMLPMLCFPAVLFSGAVLPVPVMAGAGSVISAVTSDRWAFEALGRRLGLATLLAHDPSGQGQHLLADYRGTFSGPLTGHLLVLALFGIVLLVAGHRMVTARTTPSGRHGRRGATVAATPTTAR